MDNRPIGFFDSGLGGLTCIPYLMKALPDERIVYFGDTARTPYGSKAVHTIRSFAFEITDFLASEDVKMIVIACNTVSATCLRELRERHPELPILGIISPAARTVAADCTAANRIGIIGTKVTIASGVYRSKILGLAPSLNIHEAPCPIFVPLIEEGIVENEIMDLSVKHYLDEFITAGGIDTLVLGCTHYPLIKKSISRLYPSLKIIDPSKEVVGSIKECLGQRGLLAGTSDVLNGSTTESGADEPETHNRANIVTNNTSGANNLFYASDLSENFVNMIDRIFQGTGFTVAFKNFDLEAMV